MAADSSSSSISSKHRTVQPGASLLLAWQLKNRKVLIVGGGNVAADRLRSVLPADAKVTLVCPRSGIGEEVLYRVLDEREKWKIAWRDREFLDSDIIDEEWDMILTALDDPDLSKHIYGLARKRKMNINVADVPPLCDFYFGSVIRRGPLQVMISTNGKGPRVANRVRRQIEAGLPSDVGQAIDNIGSLRAKLRKVASGSDAATVKRRMEWMVRVTDSWTLSELAAMQPDQQEAILSGWEEDYARSYTAASGKWYRRALCPYWLLQTINPMFWLRGASIQPEKLERRRENCPVYKAKSAVEPSSLLYWLSAVGGAAVGGAAVLAVQQARRQLR